MEKDKIIEIQSKIILRYEQINNLRFEQRLGVNHALKIVELESEIIGLKIQLIKL